MSHMQSLPCTPQALTRAICCAVNGRHVTQSSSTVPVAAAVFPVEVPTLKSVAVLESSGLAPLAAVPEAWPFANAVSVALPAPPDPSIRHAIDVYVSTANVPATVELNAVLVP